MTEPNTAGPALVPTLASPDGSTPVEAVAKRDSTAFSPWREWDAMKRFAADLVASGFCPSGVRTPAQVIAIIQTGRELGIPPMRALRQIHPINNRPTMAAELMLAKMLQGGVKVEWVESTDAKATMRATRPGLTSFTGSFTIDEATRAGLTSKDGWRKFPAAMLRARVIALVSRVVAPDLIGGMYTPEELGADVDEDGDMLATPAAVPFLPFIGSVEPVDDALPVTHLTPDHWVARFESAKAQAEIDDTWQDLKKSGILSEWLPMTVQSVWTAKAVAEQRVNGAQE